MRKTNDDNEACSHCGYSRIGNVSGICPECGQLLDAKWSDPRAGNELGRITAVILVISCVLVALICITFGIRAIIC